MYQKVECICLICDNCGETFMDENTGFSIFVDKGAAYEAADNGGWYINDTPEVGKHYCDECYLIDDEDNIIIKKLNEK